MTDDSPRTEPQAGAVRPQDNKETDVPDAQTDETVAAADQPAQAEESQPRSGWLLLAAITCSYAIANRKGAHSSLKAMKSCTNTASDI